MKMLLTTLVAATALTASVQAHDSGPGPGGMMGPGNDSMNGMMGPGMMMGGYSDDQRERFNQSYREMERLMERIHQTDDPDERDRLMHEHMHRLQEGMMMMGRGWTPGNRSGDAPGKTPRVGCARWNKGCS